MAQALVRFLTQQHVERDGVERRFFAGCWGIFGHGNVAGLGHALRENTADLPYLMARNEQAMVHAAAGYARMKDRLEAFACTSSVGPGATNMITGAAAATVDRIPVLLLPGDVFASRRPDPVLQQLEVPSRGDASVNDAFQPVSRYWDRITRPEQIVPAALAAMRVLTSPADTGAVTLALPQDVQVETFDVPDGFLAKRVWPVERRAPDPGPLARAISALRVAKRPLVVAGGGVIYADAAAALRAWCDRSGIPVAASQAGKGALPSEHPCAVGGVGATGTSAANRLAARADLVIGIGTRWSDFTTGSKTAFQDPEVRFVNVNVNDADAHKLGAIAVVADARLAIDAFAASDVRASDELRREVATLRLEWDAEVTRLLSPGRTPLPARREVIGAVNDAAGERGVVVAAAGAMPGELHRLWRVRDQRQYHVEYGFSTMGYEIAGGLGVKLAAPDRDVFVLVGDASYLMLAQELVTSVELRAPLIVVIVDDNGYGSIGALSRSVGEDGFGTAFGDVPVDLAANAASLGAKAVAVRSIDELRTALADAMGAERTTAIHIRVDRDAGVPGYGGWWDVPSASDDPRRKDRRPLL